MNRVAKVRGIHCAQHDIGNPEQWFSPTSFVRDPDPAIKASPLQRNNVGPIFHVLPFGSGFKGQVEHPQRTKFRIERFEAKPAISLDLTATGI